ncbi:putative uncharacterized protein DDB_G0282499 [Prorops nasuta]|uniref:putative uncharacterized protein DDB_G0282499 n=1 Tax=Prorops nasuta TaxID=863751 RepID=UPI0034D00A7D
MKLCARNEEIIKNGQWLEDEHMNHFFHILKSCSNYNPQSTLLVQIPNNIESVPKNVKHIQILHSCDDFKSNQGGHWVCSYYDVVQSQRNGNDCGVFAIAFATSLLYNIKPNEVLYDQKLMRQHLIQILKSNRLDHFPIIQRQNEKAKIVTFERKTDKENKAIGDSKKVCDNENNLRISLSIDTNDSILMINKSEISFQGEGTNDDTYKKDQEANIQYFENNKYKKIERVDNMYKNAKSTDIDVQKESNYFSLNTENTQINVSENISNLNSTSKKHALSNICEYEISSHPKLFKFNNYSLNCDDRYSNRAVAKKIYYELNKKDIIRKRKRFYESNKEATLKQRKVSYELNKEAILKQRKVSYESNKEATLKQRKGSYESNKEATLKKRKISYESNKEAKLKKHKISHKTNREARLTKMKLSYDVNREAILEKKKKSYKSNKETILKKRKIYYETNKSAKHYVAKKIINKYNRINRQNNNIALKFTA